MTTTLTRRAMLVLAAGALGAGAAHAAELKKVDDLPILVDKYHAIKNPAGPVTTIAPEKLKKGPVLKTAPQFEPRDLPVPRPNGS